MTEQKPWGGRFHQATDPTVERFSSSIHVDCELAFYDIQGSKAHASMLGHVGILSIEDVETLHSGLDAIAAELEDETFPFDPALEDIHMNIESRLFALVGPVAGRLHTGRSRNDQVATDLALWMRDAVTDVRCALLTLREVLLGRASEEIDTVLPGYTHMQRAQPVRLAHHFLAYAEMFGRDSARFASLEDRLRHCPLGAGALAGSTLPLDREYTAALLGFSAPTRNSIDTVAARDNVLEFLSVASISMVHLSRISEELVLWSTSEFGFVELSDAYSTGSSLMPQKKNPDPPELVRGKTGRVFGDLMSMLTTMKGLPLSYNRDMQEDKEPLFDAAATLCDCLEVIAGAVASMKIKRERMLEAADDPMLLATDLAEELVRQGVPFREAHEVTGKIVAHCVTQRLDLRTLTREDLKSFHPAFTAKASELVDLERALERRTLVGGTARETVTQALEAAEESLVFEATQIGVCDFDESVDEDEGPS